MRGINEEEREIDSHGNQKSISYFLVSSSCVNK
jgi:hypothetical protein